MLTPVPRPQYARGRALSTRSGHACTQSAPACAFVLRHSGSPTSTRTEIWESLRSVYWVYSFSFFLPCWRREQTVACAWRCGQWARARGRGCCGAWVTRCLRISPGLRLASRSSAARAAPRRRRPPPCSPPGSVSARRARAELAGTSVLRRRPVPTRPHLQRRRPLSRFLALPASILRLRAARSSAAREIRQQRVPVFPPPLSRGSRQSDSPCIVMLRVSAGITAAGGTRGAAAAEGQGLGRAAARQGV